MSLNTDTRLGRMLDAGMLTATVTSKKTGKHLTVTLKAIKRNDKGHWDVVDFDDAPKVYVNEGNGAYGTERLGFVVNGQYQPNRSTGPAFQYAVNAVLAAAHDGQLDREHCTIQESNHCGRCGIKLTDPKSIARGIGPDCYGKITKSRSARAAALAEKGVAA